MFSIATRSAIPQARRLFPPIFSSNATPPRAISLGLSPSRTSHLTTLPWIRDCSLSKDEIGSVLCRRTSGEIGGFPDKRRFTGGSGSNEPPAEGSEVKNIHGVTTSCDKNGKVIQFTSKNLRGSKIVSVEKIMAELRSKEPVSKAQQSKAATPTTTKNSHPLWGGANCDADSLSANQNSSNALVPSTTNDVMSNGGTDDFGATNCSSDAGSEGGKGSLQLTKIIESWKKEAVSDSLWPLKAERATGHVTGSSTKWSRSEVSPNPLPGMSTNVSTNISSEKAEMSDSPRRGGEDGGVNGVRGSDGSGDVTDRYRWLKQWQSKHALGNRAARRWGSAMSATNASRNCGGQKAEGISKPKAEEDGCSTHNLTEEDERMAMTIRLIIDREGEILQSDRETCGTDDDRATFRPVLTEEEIENLIRGESRWQKLLRGEEVAERGLTTTETDYVTQLAIQNLKKWNQSASSSTDSPSRAPAKEVEHESTFCFGENMTSVATKAAASISPASSSLPSSTSSPVSRLSTSSTSSSSGGAAAASYLGKMGVSALGILGVALLSVPHEDIEEKEEEISEERERRPKRRLRREKSTMIRRR